MGKKKEKISHRPLPRSILASLREPLLDPKDGHGARSARDIVILRKWAMAMKGDDDELLELLPLVFRENLAALKGARDTLRYIRRGVNNVQIRSVLPVMTLLGMIRAETVTVPPERDGFAEVTSRQKITFEDWFEEYALGREGLNEKTVADVRDWIARGAIQRPFRGEILD